MTAALQRVPGAGVTGKANVCPPGRLNPRPAAETSFIAAAEVECPSPKAGRLWDRILNQRIERHPADATEKASETPSINWTSQRSIQSLVFLDRPLSFVRRIAQDNLSTCDKVGTNQRWELQSWLERCNSYFCILSEDWLTVTSARKYCDPSCVMCCFVREFVCSWTCVGPNIS